MLKLKDFFIHYGKLSSIAVLFVVLAGCGGGGGSDNILCGGDPCATAADPEAGEGETTEEIENIEGQGTPDSIQFISATPTQISIQGAGGDETAVVTFLVTDTAGDPVAGISVSFEPDTTAGGISLANTSDTTNANGIASTIVRAGTAATPVRVIATVAALSAETVSQAIPISTGITDFDSFTMAFSTCHVWAWDRVGETSDITIRSSDFFNNPSPDGTQISFYAEGGQIQASCAITDGGCSVVWTGQNPRAIDGIRPGRAEILAAVTGAESFVDVDSDGTFSDGDVFDTTSGYNWITTSTELQQDDRPEPWLDENENGIWDSGEFFVDTNEDGLWTDANGLYDGPLCTHSTMCSGRKTIAIGDIQTMVMAGGTPFLIGGSLAASNAFNIGPGANFTATFADVNGGTLPAGSSIAVTIDGSELVSSSSFDVFDCSGGGPLTIPVSLVSDAEAGTGLLEIIVTTPNGSFSYTWAITDDGSGV
jgi:hypothetical protein